MFVWSSAAVSAVGCCCGGACGFQNYPLFLLLLLFFFLGKNERNWTFGLVDLFIGFLVFFWGGGGKRK